ncbi:hypothetical protein ACFE04_018109 [Oxalis oulophora]
MSSAFLFRGGVGNNNNNNNNAFCGEGKGCIRKYNPTATVTATTAVNRNPTHSFLDAVVTAPLNRVDPTTTAKYTPRERHVTFNLDAYSWTELQHLKTRLFSELQRVRIFRTQIESSTNNPTRPDPIHPPPPPPPPPPPTTSVVVKKKGSGGLKRTNPLSGEGHRRKKRSSTVAGNGEMKKCGQILGKLMKYKQGWVFNKPVDAAALGLYDYHLVIKNPMDLGTVKGKLEKGLYKSPLDFAKDVRLTFNNALTYNPETHNVYATAALFAKRFEEMFDSVSKSLEDCVLDNVVCGKEGKPQLGEAAVPTNVDVRRVVGRPKGKSSRKKEMTMEEKMKLGFSLQDLPQDEMTQVLHILRMRDLCLVQDGDEIELDIATFDNDTLWELHRFVRGYFKKAASKIKSQQNVQDKNKSGEGKLDEDIEEYVDIGEEIPVANFPPVEIERDNDVAMTACGGVISGSSTSCSDSSDSDTDSGSSSGNDSDSHNRIGLEAH